ncbi:hypothetical protein CRUP_011167 [Coryphaenoides rupestris]|nr:hypothetical protein CRUP_011167 [Coryphaenoides rupestris]
MESEMESYTALYDLMDNPETLRRLSREAKIFSLLRGLVSYNNEAPEMARYVPVTLFPTPVPRAVFQQALAVQPHYNLLVDLVSRDAPFLEEALASTVLVDDFTARLFNIHKQMLAEGRSSPIVLGINRSDYMLDDPGGHLKQVEINTIAAGGFGIPDRIPSLHRHMLGLAGLEELRASVPDSNTTVRLASALHRAWELYDRPQGVPSIRDSFEFVHKTGRLSSDNRLFVDGQEVALVLYRDGFSPCHYTEESWEARLLIERSLAIKCPDIGTHLAGTKKVQQVLARPGVLEHFFPDQPQVVQQIRDTFTGLYTLDQCPEGDRAVAMAMKTPDRFVLKPQREGGGEQGRGRGTVSVQHLFDGELVRVLQEVDGGTGRAAYILMDRLWPRVERNVLQHRNVPLEPRCVHGELGIFGAYIR